MKASDRAPAREEERLSWGTLVNFAAPTAPAYLLYMMMTVVYMNFATDVLLIAPGVIGTIFFLSKVWDAVSDPLVGYWSDRTQSRFGRRKSWLFLSIVPLVAFSIMLWSPPADLEGGALLGWVIVSVFGFYTAFTIFIVPQMALGVELSPSPHERSRGFAARQVTLTLGMLGAFLFATPMILNNPEARANAATLSTTVAIVLGLSLLVCTWALPPERAALGGRGAESPVAGIRDVLRNPHARLLLLVYFIEVFGIGATSAMTPYLLIYVTKASDYVGQVFLFFTGATVLAIPFWVWLGRRYERHKLWRVAMGIQAVGYGMILFQGEGRVTLMIVSSLVNGFATACGQTLGYSIKGDVIDFDELQTGERKEGVYLAAWNFASKLGTGLMVAFSGWALQISGFVPNVPQSELTLWTIKGMTGGAPLVCLLLGMWIFSRFSLNGAEAERIRDEIESRRMQTGAVA